MTTFVSPQWRWRAAPEKKDYLVCDNEVRVCPVRTKEYAVYVVVPSEFFMYLDQVAPVAVRQAVEDKGVSFYLDQADNEKEWLFGYYLRGTNRYQDLWRYTPSTVPSWAKLK